MYEHQKSVGQDFQVVCQDASFASLGMFDLVGTHVGLRLQNSNILEA
jgi:hypothetical protein